MGSNGFQWEPVGDVELCSTYRQAQTGHAGHTNLTHKPNTEDSQGVCSDRRRQKKQKKRRKQVKKRKKRREEAQYTHLIHLITQS